MFTTIANFLNYRHSHQTKICLVQIYNQKELYEITDKQTKKTSGPGFLPAWSSNVSNSNRTHLQLAMNNCNSNSVFLDMLRQAYVIPI